MSEPDLDELLEGLEGPARDEREELLHWLLENGFSLDTIRTSITPMYLPAGRAVGDDGARLTAAQAAARTGLTAEQLSGFARSVGLPAVEDDTAAVYLAADIELLQNAGVFLELGLAPEQVLAVTRVLAHGLAQAAEVMRQAALDAVLVPGASEVELARSYGELVERLAPMLGPMVHQLLLVQLRHSVETETISSAERAAGQLPGARDVGVAFADIVGFTRLGETVEPALLEGLASQLADLARAVAAPPVRFVKTIGDAVMLVSPDMRALLRAVLALQDLAEERSDEFPQLRVGIAHGPAVSRAGDWFGAPVNLASRVTAIARPGSVVVTATAHDLIGDPQDVQWSFAGARRIRGVAGEVRLYRARASTPNGR
jgi:adenylate cyclase